MTKQMPTRVLLAKLREGAGSHGAIKAAWKAQSEAEQAAIAAYHEHLEQMVNGRNYHRHAPDMAGWLYHLLHVLGDRLRLDAREFAVIRETMRLTPRQGWHQPHNATPLRMAAQCSPRDCLCRRTFIRQPRWTIWPGDSALPCVPRYVVLRLRSTGNQEETDQFCQDVEQWCERNMSDWYHIDWTLRVDDKAFLSVRDDTDMAFARLTYE